MTRKDRNILFSPRELEVIEALKKKEIVEVAKELKISRATVDNLLSRVRDKIDLGRETSNLAANWLDGAKNPRLAKLLRRQR
jgi:DNA-binding CsgD family transcriptional regulator